MTNSTKANTLQLLAEELKKIGFKKRANRWFISTNKVIKLIELQSSSYWDGYYINLGVCFEELKREPLTNIATHDCHLVTRINSTPLDDTFFHSRKNIGNIIENTLVFFEKSSSLDWLKKHFPEDIKENNIELMNIKAVDLKNYIGSVSSLN